MTQRQPFQLVDSVPSPVATFNFLDPIVLRSQDKAFIFTQKPWMTPSD